MTEFLARVRRILALETALLAIGFVLFFFAFSLSSAAAFLAAGFVSLASFYVLSLAAKAIGGGSRFHLLLGFVFTGRFLLYAAVISAILDVYPDSDNEVLAGLLVSVISILIEAIYTTFHDART